MSLPSAVVKNLDPVQIVKDSDATISVRCRYKGGTRYTRSFGVNKALLIKNSEYFKRSFCFNDANGHSEIRLDGDNIAAIQIWLIYLHIASDTTDTDISPPMKQALAIKKTTIHTIWSLIVVADKYDFKVSLLRGFFKQWYESTVDLADEEDPNDACDSARQLALPCWIFDHADGFAEVTKWLAYHSHGHIKEKRPDGFKFEHMHLAPLDFVGPMNAARGRLKSILHAGIWSRVGQLLREGRASTTCTHAPESAGLFLDALVSLGTYPLEEIWPKNSVTQVLHTLSRFSDLRTGRCGVCTVEWKSHVEHAVEKTEGYFDGLCLDCMKRSWLPRGKDPDTEYWSANGSDKGRWDTHCRIKHGQPTWYASFCGRDDSRQRMIKEHNEEKREEERRARVVDMYGA